MTLPTFDLLRHFGFCCSNAKQIFFNLGPGVVYALLALRISTVLTLPHHNQEYIHNEVFVSSESR